MTVLVDATRMNRCAVLSHLSHGVQLPRPASLFAPIKASGHQGTRFMRDKAVVTVDESSWRFGFVLSAIVAAEMALIAAAVLSN